MKPLYMFRLRDEACDDKAEAECEGPQVAAVVAAIGHVRPDLRWYVADVQVLGPPLTKDRRPTPTLIGDTTAMADVASTVTQFESGVLAGVTSKCPDPKFRDGGLWTEDEEDADLCDALVEVRAFDTTYVSVATCDKTIADRVLQAFPRAELQPTPATDLPS